MQQQIQKCNEQQITSRNSYLSARTIIVVSRNLAIDILNNSKFSLLILNIKK